MKLMTSKIIQWFSVSVLIHLDSILTYPLDLFGLDHGGINLLTRDLFSSHHAWVTPNLGFSLKVMDNLTTDVNSP